MRVWCVVWWCHYTVNTTFQFIIGNLALQLTESNNCLKFSIILCTVLVCVVAVVKLWCSCVLFSYLPAKLNHILTTDAAQKLCEIDKVLYKQNQNDYYGWIEAGYAVDLPQDHSTKYEVCYCSCK